MGICFILLHLGRKINAIKTTYSEEELIVLLQEKNETGFHYLYDHYSGALYGIILRIVQSKEYTEEVIQDVFVKIWNSIHQYDASKGRFYTWILNIARNTAIDYLKSKGVPVEKMINKPKTDQERKEDELLGQRNTSLEWFMKLPIEYKSAYIGRGHQLTNDQFDYLIGK